MYKRNRSQNIVSISFQYYIVSVITVTFN